MIEKSMDLHELRRRMNARDKALVSSKSFEEAVKMVREKYGTSEDCAAAFVNWQRTIASGGDANTTCNPNEKWHLKFDEFKGAWTKIPQPGEPGSPEWEQLRAEQQKQAGA
jgi:hypothetical protein